MESPTQNTSHGNAKKAETDKQNYLDDPKQLFQQFQIEHTPFHATKTPTDEDKSKSQWFLTVGKYRVTPPMEILEEALEEAHNLTWNKILQVIQIMILEHEAENKDLKKHIANSMPKNTEKKP